MAKADISNQVITFPWVVKGVAVSSKILTFLQFFKKYFANQKGREKLEKKKKIELSLPNTKL